MSALLMLDLTLIAGLGACVCCDVCMWSLGFVVRECRGVLEGAGVRAEVAVVMIRISHAPTCQKELIRKEQTGCGRYLTALAWSCIVAGKYYIRFR